MNIFKLSPRQTPRATNTIFMNTKLFNEYISLLASLHAGFMSQHFSLVAHAVITAFEAEVGLLGETEEAAKYAAKRLSDYYSALVNNQPMANAKLKIIDDMMAQVVETLEWGIHINARLETIILNIKTI